MSDAPRGLDIITHGKVLRAASFFNLNSRRARTGRASHSQLVGRLEIIRIEINFTWWFFAPSAPQRWTRVACARVNKPRTFVLPLVKWQIREAGGVWTLLAGIYRPLARKIIFNNCTSVVLRTKRKNSKAQRDAFPFLERARLPSPLVNVAFICRAPYWWMVRDKNPQGSTQGH